MHGPIGGGAPGLQADRPRLNPCAHALHPSRGLATHCLALPARGPCGSRRRSAHSRDSLAHSRSVLSRRETSPASARPCPVPSWEPGRLGADRGVWNHRGMADATTRLPHRRQAQSVRPPLRVSPRPSPIRGRFQLRVPRFRASSPRQPLLRRLVSAPRPSCRPGRSQR